MSFSSVTSTAFNINSALENNFKALIEGRPSISSAASPLFLS